jgi:hypothetical protein
VWLPIDLAVLGMHDIEYREESDFDQFVKSNIYVTVALACADLFGVGQKRFETLRYYFKVSG